MHGLSITCGVPVPDNDNTAPDLLPVLSRGRHRNASKGACFMERASFLAGERWSDHPSCTHPLLAELARSVNDYTTDAARPRLATLIPVIGLTSSGTKIDVVLALRAATVGLAIVPPSPFAFFPPSPPLFPSPLRHRPPHICLRTGPKGPVGCLRTRANGLGRRPADTATGVWRGGFRATSPVAPGPRPEPRRRRTCRSTTSVRVHS